MTIRASARATRAIWILVAAVLAATVSTAGPGAASAQADDCDELVTHAPHGSQGDVTAVAITSQVLVADVDGWDQVAWEASDGVEVAAVEITTADGKVLAEGGTSGEAGPAQSLTFCGDEVATTLAAAQRDAPRDGAVAAGPRDGQELPLLGAVVGVLLAGVVLLLSHGSRAAARRGRELTA